MPINLIFSKSSQYSIDDVGDIFDFFLLENTITSVSGTTAFAGSGTVDNRPASYEALGTNFQFSTFNSQTFLTAGTLQAVDLTIGSSGVDFSNMNMRVEDLIDAIMAEQNGNLSAIEDFLLSQDWKITLANGDDSASRTTEIGDNVAFNPRGDDWVDGRGGDDDLFGGQGNDILKGGKGRDILNGGAGRDKLFGNDGKDKVLGGAAKDIIDVGAGADVAIGGRGNDRFVFKDNYGTNKIRDFDELSDREVIDLRAVTAISSFRDLEQNHMTQTGNDILIDDQNGTNIVVKNALLTDMDSADFLF